MIHEFTYQMVGSAEQWNLFYGRHLAGEVNWIVELPHPTVALDRIVAGLNARHPGDHSPRWSAVLTSPGRWDLLEVGQLVGELAWTNPRMLERPTDPWTQRALDGLNDDPPVSTAREPEDPI